MKVEFTVDEYIYNGGSVEGGLKGAKVYHEDGTLHTIDYVKATKGSRILKVHSREGDVFLLNQDKSYDWEVNNELQNKPITKKKSRKRGAKNG